MPQITREYLAMIFEVAKASGVARGRVGDVEFEFGRAQMPLPKFDATEAADEDDEQAQYQRELSTWRRGQGVDDDPGIDG